jgi:hypothetical protein
VENLPKLLIAMCRTCAGRDRGTAPQLVAALAAASVAAALATSCAHSTGGSATIQHSTQPSTTGAGSATHPTPTAAPPPTPVASDEDQAKQSVTTFQDAYNSQNWEAYTEMMCTAMRNQFTGVIMDYVKKGRVQNGPVAIKSMTIAITGDNATATIHGASEGLGPGTIQLPLKREDGWKVCQLK